MQKINKNNKPLSMFSLMMLNVIAVDNLRSLSVGAEYGFSLIFFYLLAAILFFIPSILVTAELASSWPTAGGVYIWVKEAFGERMGFITIWLQWVYNVVWYPTIFAFIASMIAYLFNPHLVNDKTYMLSIILSCFWIVTLLNCLGLKVADWISTIGALIGTIFPMVFIAILGFIWLLMHKQTALIIDMHHFFPNLTSLNNLAFLTNILFGLMGMEMSAVHAGDVKCPEKDYPRALCWSTLIILVTLISACLAIAIVIPAKHLNLISGFMDAFSIFFHAYHLIWCIPLLAVLIIIGSISGASAWIIGPARGLLIASKNSRLPQWFNWTNQKNMPISILLTQGVIVTVLSILFLLMPTVNSSYWILSNLTAQLALLFYIFLFAAAIWLRYKHPNQPRIYKIPGGKLGMCIVSGIGLFACVGAIILGFLPPSQVKIGNLFIYEMILIIGILACIIPAIILSRPKATLPS